MTQIAREKTRETPHELIEPGPVPKHVLVAVDHSEPSRWAVKAAEALAGRLGADLRLVYVLDVDTCPENVAEELVREGEQFVGDFPARAAGSAARVDRVFRMGRPAEEVVAAANDWSADLIVVGTHGRTGLDRMLLGSTAEGILRRAGCPVMGVGHDVADSVNFARILVAVDDGPHAALSAGAAASFGRALGSRVTLLHVAPFATPAEPEYGIVLESADQSLRRAGEAFLNRYPWPADAPKPERVVRQGPSVAEILQAAREAKADLIFLGTHGRRGLRRLVLGSTAEAVLRRSPCPVICFKRPTRRTSHSGGTRRDCWSGS